MQLRLPWPLTRERRQAPAPPTVLVGGLSLPLDIRRHHWARRYVLRVTPEGRVRLTVPRRASVAAGVRFANSQTSWISREWDRLQRSAAWGEGTPVWFRGESLTLKAGESILRLGVWTVPSSERADARSRVEEWMRTVGASELPTRARTLAAERGLTPGRIAVRDQRSRWGACSARKTITLNWRLVQMPPTVADYVILHELAHLKHPNHSRRFWREVNVICPWWRDAERWLRTHGRELL